MSSDFVHWLDGDDCLHPEFLEKSVLYLNSNPHVGVLGVQFTAIDAVGRDLGSRRRSRWMSGCLLPRQIPDSIKETPFEVFFYATGQGPFSVFRKSIFERTKRWTESFWTHEDSDIFCQMALLSEVHYLPEELYTKREHPNSITASRKKSHYGEFRIKWDNYSTGDLGADRKIAKARWWYYHRHRPFRDFKIALKALRNVKFQVFSPKGKWARMCLYNAFWGAILGDHRLSNNWR